MPERVDALVIGAGPAGLTAAIYLARFRLSLVVVDAGGSRAATIPRTRNHAGYPGGIPGAELLARMRAQAAEFGVAVLAGEVAALARDRDGFAATLADGAALPARTVLLATGVVNNRPRMDAAAHDAAVAAGRLRYCPVCDGYEVTDARVGVVGTRTHGFNEAVFLRTYTREVTLIAPDADLALSDGERARLDALGVRAVAGPCGPLRMEGQRIVAPTPAGDLAFDSIYPALGSAIRSELAVTLGVETGDGGCLVTDAHQRTSLPGLYAAGDVVRGLDQISHAMGEAGVAATTIRNDLAERQVLAR